MLFGRDRVADDRDLPAIEQRRSMAAPSDLDGGDLLGARGQLQREASDVAGQAEIDMRFVASNDALDLDRVAGGRGCRRERPRWRRTPARRSARW